jgi:hypothetical protein
MPLAWFIGPYVRRDRPGKPTRYPVIGDSFGTQILADSGAIVGTEILGSIELVKVRASAATLNAIGATAGVFRFPVGTTLVDSLTSLSNGQKNSLNTRLLALGYSQSEIDNASGGNWGTRTLGDLLRLAATRVLKPRYDIGTDSIVNDGVPRNPGMSPDQIDAAVQ